MNHNKALVIVDVQRGFMPTEEGERLGLPGFGELGVPDGQMVVPPLNMLTAEFGQRGFPVVTTQDMHPAETAHISTTPNFIDTWPAHCIAGTPGAELHPDLLARRFFAKQFIKGDVAATSPEDDDSYTGVLAHATNEATGERLLLPDYLRQRKVTRAYVGGLALGDGDKHPLCVDSTARDLKVQGFDVAVITDAVEAVVAENRQKCFRNLGEMGIRLLTAKEALAEVFATPEVIR